MLFTLVLNSILVTKFTKNRSYFILPELSYIICCIIVNVSDVICSILFHIPYGTTATVPYILRYLIDLALVCLVHYLGHKLIQKHLAPALSKVSRFTYFLILFLIIDCCYIIYSIAYFSGSNLDNSQLIFLIALYIVFAIITTAMVIVIFQSSKKQFETQKKIEYLENLNAYTENLELLYNNLRSFKHDYVNVMTSLSAYIDEKQYDKLESFFYDQILPMRKELVDQSGTFNNLLNINVLELKSIIYSKLLLAVSQNIDVTIDIPDSIDSINMDPIDLIRILGIFFDNAIEAALETTHPIVNLHIGKMNENVIIIISNNFVDKGLSVAQMQQKDITTK